MINWRTDVENAPKDGTPILVVDHNWNYEWCKYAVRVVSWEKLRDEDPDDRGDNVVYERPSHGWAKSFDHEYGITYTVDNFKYWHPLNPPEEMKNDR
jgi:hypothetical protein